MSEPVLTARQLEILQHSLGVDEYGRGQQYRNFFCAGEGDEDVCRELIALGFMRQHRTTEVYPYLNCSVTNEGRRAMFACSPKPPRLTRAQRRYQEWLRIADVYDITFGEWLKRQKAADRALSYDDGIPY